MIRISAAIVFLAVVACAGTTRVAAETEWRLVTDRAESMPMDQVLYLVASDASDRLTVVGTEGEISDVARVTFEAVETTGIVSPVRDNKDTLVLVDNAIIVYGLGRDAIVRIYSTDGTLRRSAGLSSSAGSGCRVSLAGLPAGIYIADILGRTVKILKN